MIAGIPRLISNIRSAIDRILHPRIFWILLLTVASVPAFRSVLHQDNWPATLWFPGIRGMEKAIQMPVAELRYVSAEGDILDDAVRILDELFLGSLNAKHESLTIPGSYVQAALFRKNILYIDLSTDILFGRQLSSGIYKAPQFQPAIVLALVSKTLAWNFPGKRIVLTVGGYEPSWGTQVTSK
ncbi:MAG: hypothetical protein ABIJ86_04560 [Spirochaetota bacterium]